MPRKPIILTIELGAEAAPLSGDRLIGSFDLVAADDNSGPITLTAATGEAEMVAGARHSFFGVNLAELTAAGEEGDRLFVIGNTSLNG